MMGYLFRKILWVDCIGAIVTGLTMLAISGWLSGLYVLPLTYVIGHAAVHLTYGSYSFSLAVRKQRPMWMLNLLIFANAAWAVLCAVFAARLAGGDSVFAAIHFLIEGVYVGSLASIEWTRREYLAQSKTAAK